MPFHIHTTVFFITIIITVSLAITSSGSQNTASWAALEVTRWAFCKKQRAILLPTDRKPRPVSYIIHLRVGWCGEDIIEDKDGPSPSWNHQSLPGSFLSALSIFFLHPWHHLSDQLFCVFMLSNNYISFWTDNCWSLKCPRNSMLLTALLSFVKLFPILIFSPGEQAFLYLIISHSQGLWMLCTWSWALKN